MFNPEPSRASPEQNRLRAIKTLRPMLLGPKQLPDSQTAPVDAQTSDDPRRRPRIPSFDPTMSISEPGEAPTRDATAQGAGL